MEKRSSSKMSVKRKSDRKRGQKMNKKLGELKVNKSADYYGKVVKALEDAGFIIVLDHETTSEAYYIVAESEE